MSAVARHKISLMLRCFLLPTEEDALKLQAAHLLLFTMGDDASRTAALEYLKFYVENRNLNYAEKGSIAAVMKSFLENADIAGSLRDTARYILFVATPGCFDDEAEQ